MFGRIVGQAAAAYSAALPAQVRSAAAVQTARDEILGLLAADGDENVRTLQRAIRDTMTEHAGVVRDDHGLRAGLAELNAIETRMGDIGVHPDIAGYQDLAHAFDLTSAALAARATLEAALERRETRGCHNRSDYPELDPALQVNLVWVAGRRRGARVDSANPNRYRGAHAGGVGGRQARRVDRPGPGVTLPADDAVLETAGPVTRRCWR
ncbi:hypothetical protein [Cryobacterium sp.]|uniref:hypothetical protein n=1 Tax=Cryobacterium sp. TaxID=1926290 RepID=UPI002634B627|nr:hypothetical protein [Cryobacterium sp.]MCU1446734.1 succinate dehydrogenase [Cryobacterium sp.]